MDRPMQLLFSLKKLMIAKPLTDLFEASIIFLLQSNLYTPTREITSGFKPNASDNSIVQVL